jgi:HSP20 family protein
MNDARDQSSRQWPNQQLVPVQCERLLEPSKLLHASLSPSLSLDGRVRESSRYTLKRKHDVTHHGMAEVRSFSEFLQASKLPLTSPHSAVKEQRESSRTSMPGYKKVPIVAMNSTIVTKTSIDLMQALSTAIRRIPRLNRVTTPRTIRLFSTSPTTMSLFPRFTQEFAPIFRLFDEYDRQAFKDIDRQFHSVRSFTPKFDVKETKTGYELYGELPGVEQKDVNIEWTDNNTLTISGRHEHAREEGQRPHGLPESSEEQSNLEHPPIVENESAGNKSSQAAQSTEEQALSRQVDAPKAKYWVSERSVGEFHRSFAFPSRVDQDMVKASLRNGILSILIPKAQAPQSRKINIE